MDADKKCAPGKKYENNSCFTLDSLKIIAEEYNKKTNDKIKISNNKIELIEQFKDKFSSSCSSQICWLRTKIVKNINNDEIHKNTFRPEGPTTKYGWLSTTNINDVIDQYHNIHNDFLFLGTVPYDFQEISELGLDNFNFDKVNSDGKNKLGLVINLDESHQNGSHWVALYANLDKYQIYFFDSVGKPPRTKIKKFINKITNYLYKKKYNSQINVANILNDLNKLNKQKKQKYTSKIKDKFKDFDIRYNNIQHQFKNSECGVYSINFIIRLVKGETFDSIINNITKDEKMNECRQTYFNNI
jgi:hypothetical protein